MRWIALLALLGAGCEVAEAKRRRVDAGPPAAQLKLLTGPVHVDDGLDLERALTGNSDLGLSIVGPDETVAAHKGGPGAGAARPWATVGVGDPTVAAGGDREAIRNAVAARSEGLRLCYEKLMSRGTTWSGELRLAFVVRPEGRADGVSIKAQPGDWKFVACVVGATGRMRLPARDAPLGVEVPIRFTPIR